MEILNYSEISNKVLSDDKSLYAIVITNKECSNCSIFLEYIKQLEPKYPSISFLILELDELPLFALPMFPSVTLYHRGLKDREVGGLPESIKYVDRLFEDWLDMKRSMNETSV
jgi:hypothetical protein